MQEYVDNLVIHVKGPAPHLVERARARERGREDERQEQEREGPNTSSNEMQECIRQLKRAL